MGEGRRRAKLGTKQKKMLAFLRQNAGKVVSEVDLLAATGRKPRSFRVDLGNGHYRPYLQEVEAKKFRVTAPRDLDERAFLRQVSQTAVHRELGACFDHPLAKRLIQKARDNFILALELYNRPSLENRLDAFSQLFCTAWEQALKAEIVDKHGEETIYLPKKPGRRRESIGLSKAIELVFGDPQEPVARNLSRIAELRNGATHLLMPETAAPISLLFQAGVLNFARRFRSLTGEAILPENAGLLSLVGSFDVDSSVDMKKLYGQITAAEIGEFKDQLVSEIAAVGHDDFAISVKYELVLTKKHEKGDISLTSAAGADTQLRVVEKPVSASSAYPYITKRASEMIQTRLQNPFSQADFQAIVDLFGWKNSNNEHHHFESMYNRRSYSAKCIDDIVAKLETDPGLLPKALAARKARAAATARSRK